jgi:hypothetical protein
VQIRADFPLTATLFREESVVLSITANTQAMFEVPTAQAGRYRVEVRGTNLDAYTLRARVYDPRSRIRAWELEAWLRTQLLPRPPELLPDCRNGCPPMPGWLRDFPFEAATLFALRGNNVTPVAAGLTMTNVMLGDRPTGFALGTTRSGEFRLRASLLGLAASAEQRESEAGLHALLLGPDGMEVWRVENQGEPLDRTAKLEAGRTYLLLIAGPLGSGVSVSAELPGMAGDSDDDDDVDLADMAMLQSCFSGTATRPPAARCGKVDVTLDGRVNGEDFAILQGLLTGPR